MTEKFKGIFDCTLRDGGYYTNWDFGDELLSVYLDAMAENHAVFGVELGYRAPIDDEYRGRFFHLPKRLFERARLRLRSDQTLAVMLNEKESTPELMPELLGDLVGVVDMVRFATPPSAIDSALALTRACVNLGFQVGLNIMYMHKYADSVDSLAALADAPAAAIALVDSYGSCTPMQVRIAIERATQIFSQPIGFHGHDNIGMAFANSYAAIEGGASSIDATIQGMGRGAGNVKTELMIAYLALVLGHQADFSTLSKVAAQFGGMQKDFEWGTNLAYMISGFAKLPQADVMDWFGTRRYSLGSIVSALRQQGGQQIDYRSFPDMYTAKELQPLRGCPQIIIGGGESVREHLAAIADMAVASQAVIVHSTTRHTELFASVSVPQVICLAGEEIGRLPVAEHERILAGLGRFVAVQPSPRLLGAVPDLPNCYQVANAFEKVEHMGPIADEAPLGLSLSVSVALGASKIYLAGFDGYPNASPADQKNAENVQAAICNALARNLPILAITKTRYQVPQFSVYAAIQGKSS